MEKLMREVFKYTVQDAPKLYRRGLVKALGVGTVTSEDNAVDLIVGYHADGSELVLEGVPCPVELAVSEGMYVDLAYEGGDVNAPYVAGGAVVTVQDEASEVGKGLRWAESEIPSGVVDGVNRIFELAYKAYPASSLRLFTGGILVRQGVDYTLSDSTITFAEGRQPDKGEWLLGFYRY